MEAKIQGRLSEVICFNLSPSLSVSCKKHTPKLILVLNTPKLILVLNVQCYFPMKKKCSMYVKYLKIVRCWWIKNLSCCFFVPVSTRTVLFQNALQAKPHIRELDRADLKITCQVWLPSCRHKFIHPDVSFL